MRLTVKRFEAWAITVAGKRRCGPILCVPQITDSACVTCYEVYVRKELDCISRGRSRE